MQTGVVSRIQMTVNGDKDAVRVFLLCAAVAAIIVVVVVIVPILRLNRIRSRVDAITDKHIDELVRQRTILVRDDHYGKPILDKWHTEVNSFITHHVRPALNRRQQLLMDRERAATTQRILRRVADGAKNRPAATVLPPRIDSKDFEVLCGEVLSAHGWNVRLTPDGRDQGIDVIAEKNGVRVALQCKLYSKPVGNKAVQEAAAGRVHYDAHFGAVVTNDTFTPFACELAASNGIHLLHYIDLAQLGQKVGSDTLIRPFELGEPQTRESTPQCSGSIGDSSSVDFENRNQFRNRRHLMWGLLCIFVATGFYFMRTTSPHRTSKQQ